MDNERRTLIPIDTREIMSRLTNIQTFMRILAYDLYGTQHQQALQINEQMHELLDDIAFGKEDKRAA